MKKAIVSDCEGPITKNDNAFEITSHYVPKGDRLFTVISKYDDALAGILKRLGHKPGNTLKLILPFLKAYGVTDLKMREFSAQRLILISNITDTLHYMESIAHTFVVSTSYEHYIKALCEAVNFPFGNTFCTKVSIDKYSIEREEKNRLKELAREILQMKVIKIPSEAETLSDFPQESQVIIRRLDEIFSKEIANMESGKILCEVNPVGGSEKARAVEDAAEKAGVDLSGVMYVGDSITDVDAFKRVRENGGLAVSFNGNSYAIRKAEVAVLAENSVVTSIIADVFCRTGKQETLDFIENWNREALKKSVARKALLNRFFNLYPGELPIVKLITRGNIEILTKKSGEFRKKVRGEAVGRLG